MNAEYRQPQEEPASIFVTHDVPERRLMLAVLEEALITFRRGVETSTCGDLKTFREVDRWFRSEECDWPFSFHSICSSLRIDPACVRDGLNRLREAAFLDRQAPAYEPVRRKRRVCTRRAR